MRVVPISSPFAALTFPSSKDSRVPIYCWVNREFSAHLIEGDSDPETFHPTSQYPNHYTKAYFLIIKNLTKYGITAFRGDTQIWVGQGCAAQDSKPIPIFKGDFGRKGYPFLRIFLRK